MATHCSILAWRIPWTEEPGRLQSMGSQELDTTQQISTQQHTQCLAQVIPQLKLSNCHLNVSLKNKDGFSKTFQTLYPSVRTGVTKTFLQSVLWSPQGLGIFSPLLIFSHMFGPLIVQNTEWSQQLVLEQRLLPRPEGWVSDVLL